MCAAWCCVQAGRCGADGRRVAASATPHHEQVPQSLSCHQGLVMTCAGGRHSQPRWPPGDGAAGRPGRGRSHGPVPLHARWLRWNLQGGLATGCKSAAAANGRCSTRRCWACWMGPPMWTCPASRAAAAPKPSSYVAATLLPAAAAAATRTSLAADLSRDMHGGGGFKAKQRLPHGDLPSHTDGDSSCNERRDA